MFKSFQNTRSQFKGFPNLNFQMNNEAYGFSGASVHFMAETGLSTQTDGGNISKWTDRLRGISFIQNTAVSQPIYDASSTFFNNYPCVTFLADSMIADLPFGGVGTTFAFIVRCITNAPVPVFLTARANANQGYYLGGTSGGYNSFGYRNVAPAIDSGILGDTNTHIAVITDRRLIVDGVQVATVNFSPFAMQDLLSGFSYEIAEIINYNTRFEQADCVELSDRINQKYAIY